MLCSEFQKLWFHVQMIDKSPQLCLGMWGSADSEHRWLARCMCVYVRAFLCVSAYLKQIVLFVCTVMDITSSLQADALHQRGSAKRILGSEGELQLGAALWLRLYYYGDGTSW